MSNESDELVELVACAAAGNQQALDALFSRYRGPLGRMVRLRMNRKLQGRVDASDILQESFLEASRRLPDYSSKRPMPFYLWLRHIAGQKLVDAHRRHLGARRRDAGQEVSLRLGGSPTADSDSMAVELTGGLTSPSQAVAKAELRERLEQLLAAMESLDREILALRHFEQLSNAEVAEALSISPSTAASRYFRALRRLREAAGDEWQVVS